MHFPGLRAIFFLVTLKRSSLEGYRQFNAAPRTRYFSRVFLTAYIAASFWFLAAVPSLLPYNHPPEWGDGHDYDMIAFCLARGDGFGYMWSDEEFRRPYAQSDSVAHYKDLLSREGTFVSTTYRPPFVPFALAGIYRIFGRHFWIWRATTCLFTAAAVAIGAALMYRALGLGPCVLTFAWGVLDPYLLSYCPAYMTEAPAVFGLMLFMLCLNRWIETGRKRWVLLSGAVLGGLTLVRSVFALWYVLAAVFVWGVNRWHFGEKSRARTAAVIAMFLAMAIVVPLPWWIRNCIVLDRMMPLGTQGHIALPSGYSDQAILARGEWSYFEKEIAAELLRQRPDLRPWTLEFERELAETDFAVALWWAVSHPHRIPQLAWLKAQSLWKPRIAYYGWLIPIAFCGCIAALRSSWAWPGLAFLGMHTMVVAATYSWGARFLMILSPVLHFFAGLGAWALFWWVRRQIVWMRARVLPAGSAQPVRSREPGN
ncbi:MAG: hypothetical protein A3K19_17180 [Lentisphaerae bacterium RIFOXYB12_FULL_65_16]|nr:MAG: hypothetical protein A3K18_34210 [Lentisphaerae bacterium RIFOXYA12_64_32]OGV93521.1 MAG: hypothetical protein A3K19_17180 [Lentisphaerae bacterium RIFOXYB12_FULL_65_16]